MPTEEFIAQSRHQNPLGSSPLLPTPVSGTVARATTLRLLPNEEGTWAGERSARLEVPMAACTRCPGNWVPRKEPGGETRPLHTQGYG